MEGDADDEIGTKLRSIRVDYGLSQRALSRRSGVANATISQIESGQLNPTVSLLKRVVGGFPMSMSEFFTYTSGHEEQVFFSAKDMIEISRNGVSYRQIGGRLRGRSIQFLVEEYAPRTTTGRVGLVHEGEECGFVLEGRLSVTVDGQTRVLSAGEGYYFSSMLPHSFRNEEEYPCKLVSACSPPTF